MSRKSLTVFPNTVLLVVALGIVVVNDTPYIEDLLFYLKRNEEIKKAFPSIGAIKYFIDPKRLELLTKKDCPFDRAVWIYLGPAKRKTNSRGCYMVEQSIGFVILKKCLGKNFEFEEEDGEIKLSGDYLELTKLRSILIQELKCFESPQVLDFEWVSTDAVQVFDCWLSGAVEFKVVYTV